MNPQRKPPYASMGQWTPHQAVTTVLFLERLAALIWRRHGTDIGRFLDETEGVQALGPFAPRVPQQMALFPRLMTPRWRFHQGELPWEAETPPSPNDSSIHTTQGGQP
jgi:hypothetical protein